MDISCYRALDSREYLMIIIIFFLILIKTIYIMTPHLSRLVKTVQMRDHNLCFYAELPKSIPYYHEILPLI